jgi:Carboxypeptidase regulatory-like domain/TonB dependent receptor-like, beta-barrel
MPYFRFATCLHTRLLGSLLVLLAAFGLCIRPVGAQVLYGTLVGTIQDKSGAIVTGVLVTITSKDTGQRRETVTDEAGHYSLPNLLPGVYEIKASKQGFIVFTQTGLSISANNVTRVDVEMKVGNITDMISVSPDATTLQTETASVRGEFSAKEILTAPLNVYRNHQALLNLIPGTTPGRFQNANTDTPARALTTNVNGTARNNNNNRLDGATNIYIWLPHHTVYVAPAETIQEVSVSTASFDAEQGLAGGASISVVTKSGTNEFHGSVFAYHDNHFFRAKNFFHPNELGKNKPKNLRHIDGATFGGPIRRDKLFFFGGWEGMRERLTKDGRFTVPTPDQRRGDFSAYGVKIYDPTTGNVDGAGREQFQDGGKLNVIPTHRLHPIARKLQDLIPLPNLPGTSSNYYASAPQLFDRDNFDAKLNWSRTGAHQIWGKFSFMRAEVTGQFALGEAGGPCLCGDSVSSGLAGTGDTKVYVATIGHTWTLGPNFVVDGNFGFTRMDQTVLGPDFGQNFGLEVLGTPGTNGPDRRQSGKPRFDIAGYTTLGNVGTNIFRNDQSFTGTTNVSKIQGAHELRFGFDLVRHEINHWEPGLIITLPRGGFLFTDGPTSRPGEPSNQFNAYAAFLLGLPFQAGKTLQFELLTTREWQFGSYFRDRWQPTRKLTVTLGLRYELFPLMRRANRGIERIDFANSPGPDLRILVGGRGQVPENAGVTTSKKLFAPRLGLAYRLNEATVIRSGYGITYDPMPFGRPLIGFYPLTIVQNFVSNLPGATSRTPYLPLDQGIPAFTGPDLSSGVVTLPGTAEMRTPPPGKLHRGYIQSWNIFVEGKLPAEFVLDVGYVGTQTTRQLADLELNAAEAGKGRGGQPLFVKHGRTASTLIWDGFLSAHYHAFQVALNRRLTKGLFVRGAYTYSKANNSTDDTGWAGLMFNAPSQLHRNRARAGYDTPHILQLGFAAELPFGRRKALANKGGVASALLGNWQVNGVFSAVSGRPFTVLASATSLNAQFNSQTADLMKPEVEKLGKVGPGQPYYDPTAFAPVTTARFGTTGRNFLRGPGYVNLDLSLFRSFSIAERYKLELRAEAFNFTNTPHFINPNSNVSVPGNFMIITSTLDDQRQIRFGVRFSF